MSDELKQGNDMGEQRDLVTRIIKSLGGVNAVARRLGISAPSVSEWKSKGLIPEDRLLRLATQLEVAGVTTRKELFPLDWHMIWPEIAEEKDIKNIAMRALVSAPLNQQPLFIFAQEVLLGAWKDDELGEQALKAMRAQRNLVLSIGG